MGGRRGGAADTRWRAAAAHLAACVAAAAAASERSQPLSVGCLNSHLRGLSEAAGARVCLKMAVVFYLTGNFLLIGLLPEFDSVPF